MTFFSRSGVFVELAEVQSVAQAPPQAVPSKKIDEKAFFDVSTYIKVYFNNSTERGEFLDL